MKTLLGLVLAAALTLGASSPAGAEPLFAPGAADLMRCSNLSSTAPLERNPGHFGCGLLDRMINAPMNGGYAPLAAVRALLGEPQVQLTCPRDPRAYEAHRQTGAVVMLDRPFDPMRRPDVTNSLIREAMRRLYARCPVLMITSPSMGFIQIAGPGPGGRVPLGEVRNYAMGIWYDNDFGPRSGRLALRWSGPAPAGGPSIAGPSVGNPSVGNPSAPAPRMAVRVQNPRPLAAQSGAVRGRLDVAAIGRDAFVLTAYSNGAYDGRTELRLAPRQCTELILRYGQGLGFSLRSTGDLGDARDVARNFAARSGGRFTFNPGTGSATAPRTGAVVSIGVVAIDGSAWTDNPYGHVGIVQSVQTVSADQIVVTLFDQNFPLPSGQWKTVTFRRAGGLWTGAMSNSVGGVTQVLRVAGWSNPN